MDAPRPTAPTPSSPLAWIAARTSKIKLGTAIMQMPARTPAMTAMTAMTLDALSGGRFILGLGPSGPQVVEGWHGVAYGKPLTRTREYVAIVRKILAREAPLEYKGEHYQIPYAGPGATGLGKPLKSILHGRKDLPIYTASIGPAGIECSAEVADGLIPVWMNPERFDLLAAAPREGLREGRAAASRSPNFDVAPFVTVRPRRRPREVPHAGEGHARALHRRHGRARQELLQRLRQAPRLRGGRP